MNNLSSIIFPCIACILSGCVMTTDLEEGDGVVLCCVQQEDGLCLTNIVVKNEGKLSSLVVKSSVQSLKGNIVSVNIPSARWVELGVTNVVFGEGIRSIADGSFAYNEVIQTICIPSTVACIPDNFAFLARNLKSVEFFGESQAVEIGQAAFYCSGLERFNSPRQLVHIRSAAFAYCKKLAHIQLANTTQTIADRAFAECQQLKDIAIPNGVSSIGQYAFFVGSSRVLLGEGVKEIGRHAFGEGAELSFGGARPSCITDEYLTLNKNKICDANPCGI